MNVEPAGPVCTFSVALLASAATVATVERYVSAAEQNGGGWVQLTFHHICNSCDAYSITEPNMQALLDWLSTRATSGAVAVETTEQVIGGTYKPAFCC